MMGLSIMPLFQDIIYTLIHCIDICSFVTDQAKLLMSCSGLRYEFKDKPLTKTGLCFASCFFLKVDRCL